MVNINNKRILGRGATATIYEAEENGKKFAAKIFHDVKKIDIKKIEAMIKNKPKKSSMKIDGINYMQYAWPLKFTNNQDGQINGFLMPLVDLSNSFSLDCYYDKVLFSKLKSANEVALTFKIAIAKNLATVVADLHKDKNYFIDLKPQNIRVTKGTHAITLLDCDGFSINDKNGSRYPADLISTDYIAPEVTNNNLLPSKLGEEQDLYALAVIIFQLMNGGTHPFQGILSRSLSSNTNDQKAAKGYYPHGIAKHSLIKPRPNSVHETWLNETRELFDLAFTGKPNERPAALKWSKHFESLFKNKLIVRCDKYPKELSHLRFKSMPCPLCHQNNIQAQNNKKTIKPASPTQSKIKQSTNTRTHSSSGSGGNTNFILVVAGILFVIFILSQIGNNNKTNNISENKYIPIPENSYESKNESPQTISKNNTKDKNCLVEKGKCYGKVEYENGSYDGNFLNGLRHGEGTYTWNSGSFYSGDWKEGEKHGYGKDVLFKNGKYHSEYTGEFYKNQLHGHGVLKLANGDIYDGDYEDGKAHGTGKITYGNGQTYEGSFRNDKINGLGTYIWPNGEKYVGELKDGKRHGSGTDYYPNGDIQSGQWKDNIFINEDTNTEKSNEVDLSQTDEIKRSQEQIIKEHEEANNNASYDCNGVSGKCSGTREYSDGTYSGEFYDGAPHGNGTYFGSGEFSGDRFEGKYVNGLRSEGIYYWSSGDRYDGYFKNNGNASAGKYFSVNGDRYEGEFNSKGQFSGKGKYFYKTGDYYEGEFLNGKMSGQGYYEFNHGANSGDTYRGEIKNGKWHGYGTYTLNNGRKEVGYWENGIFKGKSAPSNSNSDDFLEDVVDFLNTKPDITPSQPSFSR